MKRPVMHKKCGLMVAWWEDSRGPLLRAADVEFMDGTKPVEGSRFSMKCEHCNVTETSTWQFFVDRIGEAA